MSTSPAKADTQRTQQADEHSSATRRAWRSPRALAVFAVCAVGVLAGDLSFKAWSFENVAGRPVKLDPALPDEPDIPPHEPWTVVPRVLSLRLWTNTGAVFGLGRGNQKLLTLVSIVATGVILGVFLRSSAKAWVMHTALALVLAGALGNLYDRFQFNAVRDMLWLFPGVKLPFGLNWPGGIDDLYPWLFNIADAALVVGVTLLFLVMWRAERLHRAAESSAETGPD